LPQVDPYTNEVIRQGITLNPFVGQDVDPYANVPGCDINANAYTGGQDIDPYSGSGSMQYYAQQSDISYDPSRTSYDQSSSPVSAGQATAQGKFEGGYVPHAETPEEHAALMAKFAQYDAELAASQQSSSKATSESANSAQVAQPTPPPPPVTPLDFSLYVPPLPFWQTYQELPRDYYYGDNPLWARLTFIVSGLLMAPLAYAEEYLVRPVLNVPFMVKNYGMYIGEYGARAYFNFSAGETGEGV
jgi:hypothetical protein